MKSSSARSWIRTPYPSPKHLNAAGIVVHEKVSIGDDSTQIVRSVERALGDSNVVVITGGLGPTKDDLTKKTLAGMFGCELVPTSGSQTM